MATEITYLVGGVLLGYGLGFFFSNKKVFQMVLSKDDIETAIKIVNEMNKEDEEESEE